MIPCRVRRGDGGTRAAPAVAGSWTRLSPGRVIMADRTNAPACRCQRLRVPLYGVLWMLVDATVAHLGRRAEAPLDAARGYLMRPRDAALEAAADPGLVVREGTLSSAP